MAVIELRDLVDNSLERPVSARPLEARARTPNSSQWVAEAQTQARSAVIQMFWHGAPLSRMERLSIASFLHHGHSVDLYVYDEPANVPHGAQLRDAGQILPRSAVFRHKRSRSLAVFADWFRYRL